MGLFRFDGLSFVQYAGSADQPFESDNVSALATSPDGKLWIGFRFGGVGVYSPTSPYMALATAPDGAVWTADATGLMRLNPVTSPRAGGRRTIQSVAQGPLLFDREGNLWLGSTTVRRFSSRQLADPNDVRTMQGETFGQTDGLTSACRRCRGARQSSQSPM
jgi:streptogramin lyase